LGWKPKNASLARAVSENTLVYMYVNEPAECRFDVSDKEYSEMEFEWNCPASRYRTVPEFGGSYECSTVLNETKVYIRCQDNPQLEYDYDFSMTSGQPQVLGSDLVVVNETGVYASASVLNEDVTIIAPQEFRFYLYLQERQNCTLITNTSTTQFDRCDVIQNLEQGLYGCVADIVMNQDSAVFGSELRLHPYGGTNIVPINGKTATVYYIGQDLDIYLAQKDMHLELKQTGEYNCYYNGTPMTCLHNNDTICYAALQMNQSYLLECWEYAGSEARLNCVVPQDVVQNINTQSTLYMLNKSEPLAIIASGPQGSIDLPVTVFYAETNRPARCGYYEDFMLGTILMDNTTGLLHETVVDVGYGSHYYYLVCRDEYGNEAKKMIDFYVVE